MTHGSLFSGIGGFDLAAEWMGWENVFHCEWNPFGQKVLHHYWPNAISYHDITKTDFAIHRGAIEILTGGFPCQPYSMAGKRLGKEDERHLWPEMLRAIREIQPRWIVGENVLGLVNWSDGLVFHEVQTDLEAEGYEVLPFVLPACAVNAPHRRDRVWFVAYFKDINAGRCRRNADSWQFFNQSQREKVRGEFGSHGTERTTPNPNSDGQQRSDSQYEKHAGEGRKYAQRDIEQSTGDGIASNTNTNSSSARTSRESGGIESKRSADDVQPSEWGGKAEQYTRSSAFSRDVADTDNKLLEYRDRQREDTGRANTKERIKPFNQPGSWQTFPTQPPGL